MKLKRLRVLWCLALLLSTCKLEADPLNQWTWQFPNPQGYTLAAVTYGGEQFVAVGDKGAIISSVNGYNWVNRTNAGSTFLRGVAYADGMYAAIGDAGIILVSSNAVTWTQMPTVTNTTLRGIAGNPGWTFNGLPQFLAVGDSGTVISCNNVTNWSITPSPTSNALYAVTLSGSAYRIVGAGGTVIRLNTGGFTQTAQNRVGTTKDLYAVAAVGNTIAAAGDLSVNYSANEIRYSVSSGSLWTNQQWVVSGGGAAGLWYLSEFFILKGMTYGANGFVAVGYTGYDLEYHPAVVMSSVTGTNWTELPSSTSEDPLSGVTFGNGLYVAVGDFGSIIVSTNAVNWSRITSDRRGTVIASASNTNCSIAASLSAWYSWGFPDLRTLVTTNCQNWAISTTRNTLPLITDLDCSGVLFAGVSGNSIYTTTDGYNWQSNNTFSNTLHGVKYANSQFVAVGDNGGIYSSIDGSSWSNHSVTTSGSLNGIAYGNGVYAAAGTVSATSSDGSTWTISTSSPPKTITRIVYGRGLFVAAAYSNNDQYHPAGQILTCQDGTTWQSRFAEPSNEAISGLAYSGGTFVAISGFSGRIYESADGINWQPTGSSMPKTTYYPDGYSYPLFPGAPLGLFAYYSAIYPGCYTSVSACNGYFRIAGAEGMLLQSGNTWSPTTLIPVQVDPGGFTFSYNQQVDVPYHIELSTDLVNWKTIYTGIGSGQSTNFNFSAPAGKLARFFRLVSP